MTILRIAPQLLASLGLALAVAATPLAISSHAGLTSAQALAKEAESGGRKEAGDDKGGDRKGAEKGDDKGGRGGNDDHPGSHSQNGKNR